jgi:hypothetical protein
MSHATEPGPLFLWDCHGVTTPSRSSLLPRYDIDRISEKVGHGRRGNDMGRTCYEVEESRLELGSCREMLALVARDGDAPGTFCAPVDSARPLSKGRWER